jgi:Holliday junction resolvasome RuvABC endonuclease subunit
MMIILGADPGTIKFGWTAIDTDTMEAIESQFIGNNARTGIAIGTSKGVFAGIAALSGLKGEGV